MFFPQFAFGKANCQSLPPFFFPRRKNNTGRPCQYSSRVSLTSGKGNMISQLGRYAIANSCDVQIQGVLVKKLIQKLVLRIVTPSKAPSCGSRWIVSFGSCFGFISTRWVHPNQAQAATIHDQPLAWCRCESGHSTSRCRQKTMVSLHCRLLARPTVWIWQGVTEWPLYSWVGVLGCTDQWLFLQDFFRENCHVFFGKESISRL